MVAIGDQVKEILGNYPFNLTG